MVRTIALAGVLWLLAIVCPASAGTAPPRYKLIVGQELQYQAHSETHFDGGQITDQALSTLWIVRQNQDGSYRVIARTYGKTITENDGQSSKEEIANVCCFDVFADGRIVHDPTSGTWDQTRDMAMSVFTPLPKKPDQRTWREDFPDGSSLQYAAIGQQSTPGDFVFHVEEHSVYSEVFSVHSTATIHFDPLRGLETLAERQISQEEGAASKSTATTELKSAGTKEDAFIRQLLGEYEIYAKASGDYDRLKVEAEKTPEQIDALMARGAAGLREARSRVTLAALQSVLDKKLADCAADLADVKDDAREIARLLNKPAVQWTLKDLGGTSHSMADYRGKVVLLDFWYRRCGPCVMAMPQIKQVADDFKDQPVVVLGMNTDTEESDARFIADKMHLNYTTLLASSLKEKYGLHLFPTLLLIDREGIVRDVHFGRSPGLQNQLDDTIRKLLGK